MNPLRRALLLAAIAIPLLCALGVLGLILVARLAPETARAAAEQSLSEALRTPVSVAGASLSLGAGLVLEAHGIQAWPAEPSAAREVRRASALLDPASLLRGRVKPLRIELEGARLRFERDAEGRLVPDLLASLPARPAQARDPAATWVGRVRGALHSAARLALPSRTLAFREARIELPGPQGGKAAAPPLVFESVDGELRERAGGAVAIEAGGILAGSEGPAGALELEGERLRDGSLDLTLTVPALDLRHLEAQARRWHPKLRLAGLARGRAVVVAGGAARERVELEGSIEHLALKVPRGGGQPPLVIQQPQVEGSAAFELERHALVLPAARLHTRGVALELRGSLARPIREASQASLDLDLERLTLAQLQDLAGWLPPGARRNARSVLGRFESGELYAIAVRHEGSLGRLQALLDGETPLRESQLDVSARARDARIRTSHDALEHVHGDAHWRGDRLELTGLRGVLNNDPLPQLDFAIDGLHHLIAADRAHRKTMSRVGPLHGRRALAQILERRRKPGRPGWTELVLDADWIRHPVLLWKLEDVHALLTPTEAGIRVHAERAVWAGTPVRFDAEWTRAPLERFRIEVTASAPAPSAPPRMAPAAWAHGRFELRHDPRASFALKRLTGRFRAGGSVLALEDLAAPFEPTLPDAGGAVQAPVTSQLEQPLAPGAQLGAATPSGRFLGDVLLDLSQRDAVACDASLELEGVDVDDIASAVHVPRGSVTGRLDLSASLSGALRPGMPLSSGLEGTIDLRAEDGEVRRRLPFLFAISSVSDALQLFPARDALRYSAIEAELRLAEGTLRSESLAIQSPDLRLVASGRVNVSRPPHELEAVAGVFFLRPLDTVLGSVPVVSQILLGPDQSLFGAYFELTGPWSEPSARMVPMKSFASGPASFMLEGVPSFVRSGIRAIQSVLAPGAAQRSGGPPDGGGSGS